MSNSNLAQDKFLVKVLDQQTLKKPSNCVPLLTFLSFNKIKSIFQRHGQLNKRDEKMAAKDDFKMFKSSVDPIYRNNHEYLQLSELEMDQLLHLIKALKRSRVVKVCKDKFHLRRRLPFKMNDEIKKEIEECTIYVENFPHNFDLQQLFKPYGIRDLRLK